MFSANPAVEGDQSLLALTLAFYQGWKPGRFGAASYDFRTTSARSKDGSEGKTRYGYGTVRIADGRSRIDYFISHSPVDFQGQGVPDGALEMLQGHGTMYVDTAKVTHHDVMEDAVAEYPLRMHRQESLISVLPWELWSEPRTQVEFSQLFDLDLAPDTLRLVKVKRDGNEVTVDRVSSIDGVRSVAVTSLLHGGAVLRFRSTQPNLNYGVRCEYARSRMGRVYLTKRRSDFASAGRGTKTVEELEVFDFRDELDVPPEKLAFNRGVLTAVTRYTKYDASGNPVSSVVRPKEVNNEKTLDELADKLRRGRFVSPDK
ncbi:MAG: hypothetical protein AAGJ40_04530 [Planctomycetota bacterium]